MEVSIWKFPFPIYEAHFLYVQKAFVLAKEIYPGPLFGMEIEEAQGIIRVWANFEVIPEPLRPSGGAPGTLLSLKSRTRVK